MTPPTGELLLYTDDAGVTRLHVRLQDGTVWLTQAMMAQLFGKDVRTISEHLGHIYEEGELDREATLRRFRIVQTEGSRQVAREVEHYALPAILAVGYRVRSALGTRFRQWATARLEEFVVKGFTMDDARLMSPEGADYFDELLERIRAIRASERRFYQKITDIYARCSVDYDRDAQITRTFYATVQNKLHFAIHGRTAAEILVERADHRQPNMGLSTWRDAPSGPIRRADVTVAKNYLTQDEIEGLNRIVTMYLDYAEAPRDDHGGLGEAPRRLSPVQRSRRAPGRGPRVARARRGARGGGVRAVSAGATRAGGRGRRHRLRSVVEHDGAARRVVQALSAFGPGL